MNIQRTTPKKKNRVLISAIAVSVILLSAPTSLADAAPWQVGAATADITPDNHEIASGDIWLGGYGSCLIGTRRAAGVHDSIFARALVLTDSVTTLALVMVDTVGIGNRRIHAIRQRVHDATGIPKENILVGATHTHSGPDMQGLWCGASDSYKRFFDQQTAQAVIDAVNGLEPATLRTAVISHPGKQRNRRGWDFSDEDLAVVQALDVNQNPIVTLVEFAAHATCMGDDNRLISRDWPGGAQDRIELRGGGIGIVNTGDQGDVLPSGCGSGFDGAEAYGASLADAAYDSLSHTTDLDPPLVYHVSPKKISVTNSLFLTARLFGWLDYDFVYPCHEGGGIFGNPCIDAEIGYLRIGPDNACQLQAAVAPGEVLTRGGLAIKDAFTAPHVLFLGLTQNTLGYAVPSDEWTLAQNGENYEETISPAEKFGDMVINATIDMADSDSCR